MALLACDDGIPPVDPPPPPPAEADVTPEPAAAPEPAEVEVEAPVAADDGLPPIVHVTVAAGEDVDEAVRSAIIRRAIPGAVVVLGDGTGVALRRAYGSRIVEPEEARVPLREDAIFDLASLTKLFTAIAVLQLVDEGRLDLGADVAGVLPELGGRGIDARGLLTHTAGLRGADRLDHYDGDREATLARIFEGAFLGGVGRFRYSDLGFIALGVMLERLEGAPLDAVLERRVLDRLGLRDTRFGPPRGAPFDPERVVPTEPGPGRGVAMISGVVHDPRAYRLGGVAGHAGLFGSADDLARLGKALLTRDPALLSPEGHDALATPTLFREASGRREKRGLGTAFRRGEYGMPIYGMNGHTGPRLWIGDGFYVVLATSRLHPNGRGRIDRLEKELLEIAPGAVGNARPTARASGPAAFGVDVLRRGDFGRLRSLRLGLVANTASRTRDGLETAELFRRELDLVRLFVPEHGYDADAEGTVRDGSYRGVPTRSLHRNGRGGARVHGPSAEDLEGLDGLVFDLQDAGARFFTVGATLHRVLLAAAEAGIPLWVLERPNPLGSASAGPVLDVAAYGSFVNHHPLPVRHGLTTAELAERLVEDEGLDVDLRIVPMEGVDRAARWEASHLRWTPPSPNLPTAESALFYAGVALVEGTNLSVGRGTREPFARVGAPWLDADALAAALSGAPGIEVRVETFRPRVSPYRGLRCRGVRFVLTEAEAFEPVAFGLRLIGALAATQEGRWKPEGLGPMVGDDDALGAALAGGDDGMSSR
ncbi:MAG: exo-beta-N-acetylmuramidase NamZ domain-containing protein [Myxococcota bacterium]